ncbi:hypothetical protein mvi_09670 [Methylobacterium indicum]|uniref:Uncharacterized protein n=1 Tax=Methylobacterium indicum TaxID=1775910 RepID=A0A8H9C4M7_9HYPH|nr:hypothetical protein mvi_09670 [Methylobacterium indicum]
MRLGVVPTPISALLDGAMQLVAVPPTKSWADRELILVTWPATLSPASWSRIRCRKPPGDPAVRSAPVNARS